MGSYDHLCCSSSNGAVILVTPTPLLTRPKDYECVPGVLYLDPPSQHVPPVQLLHSVPGVATVLKLDESIIS